MQEQESKRRRAERAGGAGPSSEGAGTSYDFMMTDEPSHPAAAVPEEHEPRTPSALGAVRLTVRLEAFLCHGIRYMLCGLSKRTVLTHEDAVKYKPFIRFVDDDGSTTPNQIMENPGGEDYALLTVPEVIFIFFFFIYCSWNQNRTSVQSKIQKNVTFTLIFLSCFKWKFKQVLLKKLTLLRCLFLQDNLSFEHDTGVAHTILVEKKICSVDVCRILHRRFNEKPSGFWSIQEHLIEKGLGEYINHVVLALNSS